MPPLAASGSCETGVTLMVGLSPARAGEMRGAARRDAAMMVLRVMRM